MDIFRFSRILLIEGTNLYEVILTRLGIETSLIFLQILVTCICLCLIFGVSNAYLSHMVVLSNLQCLNYVKSMVVTK